MTTEETIGIIQATVRGFSWEKALMVVLLVGFSTAVIKLTLQVVDRTMERTKLDKGVRTFLRSAVKVALVLVALCVILGYLGVPMTSLVTILGTLGLAFSLAIQGTLSNLAGGLILLTTRPFSVGDFIEAGGVSGTVTELGLFYTKLTTSDTKVVHIPNGEISGKTIINYSAAEQRRIEMKFTAAYEADPGTVKACLRRAVDGVEGALTEPEPFFAVSSYQDSSVEYLLRVWSKTADYWKVYYALMEAVKVEFDRSGVSIPYPQMEVRLKGSDPVPASDRDR